MGHDWYGGVFWKWWHVDVRRMAILVRVSCDRAPPKQQEHNLCRTRGINIAGGWAAGVLFWGGLYALQPPPAPTSSFCFLKHLKSRDGICYLAWPFAWMANKSLILIYRLFSQQYLTLWLFFAYFANCYFQQSLSVMTEYGRKKSWLCWESSVSCNPMNSITPWVYHHD